VLDNAGKEASARFAALAAILDPRTIWDTYRFKRLNATLAANSVFDQQ
jgi:hypothetical protein